MEETRSRDTNAQNMESTNAPVNSTNNLVHGFILGCVVGILLTSVDTYWLYK